MFWLKLVGWFSGASIYVKMAFAAIAIALSLFTYHKVVVSIQSNTIAEQQKSIDTLTTNNATLKTNVEKLLSANETMNGQIKDLIVQSDDLIRLIKEREDRERVISEQVDAIRNSYVSQEEINRLIEEAHKDPSGTINEINSNIDCLLSNMGSLTACNKKDMQK